MLATVTNRSRSVRGFATLDCGTVPLGPGVSAVLELAEHPLHDAWAASGAVQITALADKEARAARKRAEAEADAAARGRAAALAELRASDHRN